MEGCLLNERTKIPEKWKEHFCEPLNPSDSSYSSVGTPKGTVDEDTEPPSEEELEAYIEKLRSFKAPGDNNLNCLKEEDANLQRH